MNLLAAAQVGFQTVKTDATLQSAALAHLERWLKQPEFTAYRPQIEWLIGQGRWSGLLDRFYQILPFGTGGRRGPVGIGPNRMNDWTLGASVQGHCEYLKEKFPEVEPVQVVIAYDVRRFEDMGRNYHPDLPNPVLHQTSRKFAERAASVYGANGIHVHMLPPDSDSYLATPELSFAIRQLRVHGGLNVSASHNPPDDNGGKFYDENGAQPVAPDDQIMSDLVEEAAVIRTLPWEEVVRSGKLHPLPAVLHREYIELCRKQSLLPPPKANELKVVFTPLHGVGGSTAYEVLKSSAFRVISVPEQAEPNGLFPNVTKLPNPEVPEALDRAIALAVKEHADLVLATDPDADRIGAAVKDGKGAFRFLAGNEIACLAAFFKLDQLSHQGRLPASPIVLTTEVTSRLLTEIARHFGAQVVNYLPVGFKHIADVLRQLEAIGVFEDITGSPADYVFGAEEAHGILATSEMRDKDAASAALLIAEAALDTKRAGETLVDRLDGLHRRFGYFRNELRNLVMTGIEGRVRMQRMMNRLRQVSPATIGGRPVTRFEDLQNESGRFGSLKGATDAASRNVLLFELGSDARLAVRPSGTEPKAKIYVEVRGQPKSVKQRDDAWTAACRSIDREAVRVADAFQAFCLDISG